MPVPLDSTAITHGIQLAVAPVFLLTAVAGMIGAAESIGINQRFVSQFDPGFGFDGFLVALLAGGNIAGCIPAGIFLAILKAGGTEIERTLGVSKSIIWILQGSIILVVSAYRLRDQINALFKRRTGP